MKTLNSKALCCAILASSVSLCGTLLADSTSSSATTTRSTSDTTATAPATDRRTSVDTTNTLNRADRNFFEKAAKSGVKEVTVSKAATARLTNPQVKQFADMMVSDHSKANSELMALAQKKGVMLPAEDDSMKLMDKWSKKDADDLDEDYMEEMVSDHKDAVDLYQKAAKSEDPDIAAFAMKTLPKLQQHLQMAQSLEKALD